MPRYNELAWLFAQQGVDSIVCLSVNNAFVMNAWQADQHADHIQFIPDGNGEFTCDMGMLVEKAALGFGPRSWRYSILVRNGVVERIFIEPDKSGNPFEVSDADTKTPPPSACARLRDALRCRRCLSAANILAEAKSR